MKIMVSVWIVFFLIGCSMFDKTTVEYSSPENESIDYDEDGYLDEDADAEILSDDDWAEERQELIDNVATPEPEEDEVDEKPVRAVQGRFMKLKVNCNVRIEPRGKKMHSLSKGRRLWVEEPDPDIGWYQVYTKHQLAYMSKKCF